MRKSVILIIIFAGIFLNACNKEKVSDLTIKNTDNLMFKNIASKEAGDIAWRLWRKSRDCFGGIGICHIEKQQKQYNNNENSRDNVIVPVSENDKFVTFCFSEDVSQYSADDLKFYIDETLTLNMDKKVLKVAEGVYNYDSTLGEFGGYKIPLSFE